MGESWYDVAQICKNGHVITEYYGSSPVHGEKHCSKCGEETISACLNCDASIRGKYHVPGVFVKSNYQSPLYCYECGKPYPWTVSKMKAIQDFAQEIEGIGIEEQKIIEDNIKEVTISSPQTDVAALRLKKVLSKVSGVMGNKLQEMIVAITSETAKKIILGE